MESEARNIDYKECLGEFEAQGWHMIVWEDDFVEVLGPEGITYNNALEFGPDNIDDYATRDGDLEPNEENRERIRKDTVIANMILNCVKNKKLFKELNKQ